MVKFYPPKLQGFNELVTVENYCGYSVPEDSLLKIHIESKHEGVQYSCKQCDYKATDKRKLRTHIESKYEGVCYDCNLCD